ncbi:transglutaminaseTgpA domain-containing protein [Isoptericola croceus]|uniref:transglutaminase family protein n=1 Tax=Isoptericola croceus TaxID=3031406 RepID=UPI0023F66E38|nr:transglutaminase domain-containing protein [Isoptericola croceus]
MTHETTRGGGPARQDTSAREEFRTGTGRGTTRRHQDSVPRATTLPALVDLAALLVLLGTVVVGFGPVWGSAGYLLPAAGGVVVGLGVAWIGAWRRFSAVTVTALAVLGYLLFGGVFALRHTAIAGVVPSLETLYDLLLGAVEGWKRFVTTAPPLSSFPDLAVVPYLLLLIVSLVAGTIAWRARHAVWALAPVVVGFVAVILLGTLDEALPVLQGAVIALVGLLWGGVRAMEARVGTHSIATESSSAAIRRLRWYRVRTGAAILGVAAVTAAFVAPAIMPSAPRTVLRETIVPPLDLHQYASPLVAFRHYAKEQRTDELFTISDLPAEGRVRLATLDRYDGVVFDASGDGGDTGVYSRVGESIATAATGDPVEVEVNVTGYTGVWVPEVGALTGVRWTGPNAAAQDGSTYYNSATRTAITTEGVRPGDTYTLNALVTEVPDEEELQRGTVLAADLPDVPDAAVPPGLPAKTAQFTGEEIDPATKLFLLRDALAASGVLSSGLDGEPPSRPGHSAERIDTLVQEEKMVGDDEQFAVALALMARQSGIPARVVMGFAPGEDSGYTPGEPWTVLGSDVRAWVEVPFEGHGWVPIEAVPEQKPQIQPEPQSEEVPKPPVLQEPEPPVEPDQSKAGNVEDDEQEEVENEAFDWARFGLLVLAVGIPLLLILGPIVAILAYKARRRAQRRLADEAIQRFSGGWHEVVDVATDLGSTVPASATRRESAQLIATEHQAPGTLAVAHRADVSVFGAGESSTAEAEGFWLEIDQLVGGMRAGVPRGRRLRAALSLRSVRARSRWIRSEEKR